MERLKDCQGILDLGNTGRAHRNYLKMNFWETLKGSIEIISIQNSCVKEFVLWVTNIIILLFGFERSFRIIKNVPP